VGHRLFFNTENRILKLCICLLRIMAVLFLFTSFGQKMILQTVYFFISLFFLLTSVGHKMILQTFYFFISVFFLLTSVGHKMILQTVYFLFLYFFCLHLSVIK
jgi:hypothetical protein